MKKAAIAALALGALVFAGCGDDNTKTVVSTQTVTNESTTGSEDSPDKDGTETSSGTSEAPTTIVHKQAFQSPTGNLGCMIVGGEARCDIDNRHWVAPRPPGCPPDSDFGQGMKVGESGRGAIVCAGDTTREAGSPKLAYGTGSEVDGFMCVSRLSGITCTNQSSGHGFLINAERYRLF